VATAGHMSFKVSLFAVKDAGDDQNAVVEVVVVVVAAGLFAGPLLSPMFAVSIPILSARLTPSR